MKKILCLLLSLALLLPVLSLAEEDGDLLIDALVASGAAKSKSDARKLLQQGSISLNGNRVTALDAVLKQDEALEREFSILKKGKKNYILLNF